jgi:hypothetical protein
MLQAMKKVDKETIDLLKRHFHQIARRERKSKGIGAENGTSPRGEVKIRTENLEEICNRMVLAGGSGDQDGSDADLVDLSLQFFDQGLGLHIV